MGVPTLDGLGVAGDKFHTLEEHIEIDSLSMRGRMMAGLLMQIDANLQLRSVSLACSRRSLGIETNNKHP